MTSTLYREALEQCERLIVEQKPLYVWDEHGRLGVHDDADTKYTDEDAPHKGCVAADALRYIIHALWGSHALRFHEYADEEQELKRETRCYTAYGLSETSPNAVRRCVRRDVVPWLLRQSDPLAERVARRRGKA
jgi:hypothetical protein